jgi:hypothetical protein
MSTQGEDAPENHGENHSSELETISTFSQSNEKLRAIVQEVASSPNGKTIEVVQAVCALVADTSQHLYNQGYFGASGNPMLIEAAVASVIYETEQNCELANILNPSKPVPTEVREGVSESIVAKLIDGEPPVLSEYDQTYFPSEVIDKASAADLLTAISASHHDSVIHILDNFMSSDNIVSHQAAEELYDRLKERIIMAGMAAVGAFLGTKLAQRRKK